MMELRAIWEQHRAAGWPKFSSPDEGELMTLDTVISGCATYYFEERNLDAPRLAMLEDCLGDLEALLSNVPEEAGEYFTRLRALAGLLLDTARPS
jgi:hypothetical protein